MSKKRITITAKATIEFESKDLAFLDDDGFDHLRSKIVESLEYEIELPFNRGSVPLKGKVRIPYPTLAELKVARLEYLKRGKLS